MITNLLTSINKELEELNCQLKDNDYLDDLEERIKIINESINKTHQENKELNNEIEKLKSIIKEVREHIEKTIEYEKSCGFNRWTYEDGQETYIDMVEKTLEILDKENTND